MMMNNHSNHNKITLKKKITNGFKSVFENISSSLRTQIIILSLVGWGVAMTLDRTLVDELRVKVDDYNIDNGKDYLVRTSQEKIAYIVLSVFETLLFGLGIGFFVAVGLKVFKIRNKMLKKRMVWCWGCISYFMISWWPHTTSQEIILVSGGNPQDNYIIVETAFYWTQLFCSLVLSYFQYDLILLMFEVAMMKKKMETRKECNPLKMDAKNNFKYHGIVLLVLFFGVGMAFCFKYDPIRSSYEGYQKFFFIAFKIVNSLMLGCGVAFTYISLRIISLLPASNGKKVAIISSICISLLFFIGYGHPMAHTHAPLTLNTEVIIEFTVHLPIIFLTTVLAFYQFRMLELSTDSSSSLCMAAKLRNRPHKYSFPVRSLGIKSNVITNIGNTMVGISGTESKYTPECEAEGSSAITTEEKVVTHSHRPTKPYFNEETRSRVRFNDENEETRSRVRFNDDIELQQVKKEFPKEKVAVGKTASSNSLFAANVKIAADIKNSETNNTNNETVDIIIDAPQIVVSDSNTEIPQIIVNSINSGIAGGSSTSFEIKEKDQVEITIEDNVENNTTNINGDIQDFEEEEEEVLPTEDTIEEFMHEI